MSIFKRFLLYLAVGVLGLFLASYFLEGVIIQEDIFLFYGGCALGVINFFVRPIIKIITFPLRFLTLGLFTFFINVAIIWFTQELFAQIYIADLLTLIYTTIIISALEFILHNFSK